MYLCVRKKWNRKKNEQFAFHTMNEAQSMKILFEVYSRTNWTKKKNIFFSFLFVPINHNNMK